MRVLWQFSPLFLILAAVGCSSGPQPQAQGAGRRGDMAVPVAVAKVAQKDVPLEIQVIGNVEAYSTVTVKAQVTGPLMRVHFREGDYIRKGDLLFTIDPRPFEAALNEAQANLSKNEAQMALAEATLKRDTAQAQYTKAVAGRYTALFEKGILSKDQTEQAQSNAAAVAHTLGADEAAVKSAEAAVVASRATVETQKIQLGYTIIRSPIEGRTGAIPVKEGNLITANTSELTTINQVQPIYVTFAVPEANLAAVKAYMAQGALKVRAILGDGGEELSGNLTFVDNTVDSTTGTIKLKGTFPNADHKLWPGQFVRVILRLAMQSNALVVPSQAVQTGQEGSFVFVVKADQTVESRPVVTGSRNDQVTVIQKGVAAGESVVIEGQLRLEPGKTKVRIKDAGGAPRRGPAA